MCTAAAAAAAAATAAAHTRTAASLFSSSDVRERRVRVSALLSIFLSFSVSLFVPLAAFSSGSVSAAEDGAHGSERFGSKRDEAKTRGKSAWGESRPCLVGERCERRAVERRRRRGERDASFRATGWGIVSRTAWWGATNRGFVPERRRKGQRSGTAPLLSVSLSPSGGVQSSRASRATRTRLFHVLGSVKDSLSQGLENGSRPSVSLPARSRPIAGQSWWISPCGGNVDGGWNECLSFLLPRAECRRILVGLSACRPVDS